MLRKLFSLLRAERQPSALEMARKDRRRAAEAYAAAKLVGDTRAIHATLRDFRRATSEVVRLELAQ